jgi:hypothetical protein
MLDDHGVGALAPDASDSAPGALLPPDPVVADSARLRLSTLRAVAGTRPAGHPVSQLAEAASARLIDDIKAIGAVLAAARDGAAVPADALDVGAGLVVLCDLRAHLDRLEADLLDAAQQVDLNWDLIAAIMGVPADEAQRRYRRLRGPHASA